MTDTNGEVAYIPDGYTMEGYIAAIPRLHPAVRFLYRPILVTQQALITHAMAQHAHDPEKRQQIVASWMAKQLVSWDIKTKGRLVDCHNATEVLHIHSMIFQTMWAILLQERPSDAIPDGLDPLTAETVLQETEQPALHEREKVAQKNL